MACRATAVLLPLLLILVGPALADNVGLWEAVRSGDEASLETLLASGAEVNIEDDAGVTPLFWAAYHGHPQVVRLLIDAGAGVNPAMRGGTIRIMHGGQLGTVNLDSWTPLMTAADQGHSDVVRSLVGSGASVRASIHGSVWRGTDGGEVEIVSLEDWTALMLAAYRGHADIVRALIEAGARAYQAAEDGTTAFSISDRLEHQEILGLLSADVGIRVQEQIVNLRDVHKVDRAAAADALGEMGPHAEEAVAALAEALRDDEWKVRKAAALALAEIGPASNPVLVAALNDSDLNVCQLAAQALGKVGPPARSAVPSLIGKLSDGPFYLRVEVILALGKIGDTSAVAPLSEVIKQERTSVLGKEAQKVVDAMLTPEEAQIISIRAMLGLVETQFALAEDSEHLRQTAREVEDRLDKIASRDADHGVKESAREARSVIKETRKGLESAKDDARSDSVRIGDAAGILQRFLEETRGMEAVKRVGPTQNPEADMAGVGSLLEAFYWSLRIDAVSRELDYLRNTHDPQITTLAADASDVFLETSEEMITTADSRKALEGLVAKVRGSDAGSSSTLDEEEEVLEFFSAEAAPDILQTAKPVYPEEARREGIEGTVFLRFVVGKDGRVARVTVLRGADALREAAIAALTQFRFRPGTQNGKAVSVWMSMPIGFRLTE